MATLLQQAQPLSFEAVEIQAEVYPTLKVPPQVQELLLPEDCRQLTVNIPVAEVLADLTGRFQQLLASQKQLLKAISNPVARMTPLTAPVEKPVEPSAWPTVPVPASPQESDVNRTTATAAASRGAATVTTVHGSTH